MFKNAFSNQPKIYKYWFIFTFLMGLGVVFILPPFQSPDELNHFYRIYHITEGYGIGELDSTRTHLGGNIPSSLIEVTSPFEVIPFHKDKKTSVDTINRYLNTPLNKDKKEFKEFPNTARYAVTAYTPQVLAFSFLRIFDMNPLWMMYLGRLFTFLVWFSIIAISTLKTPVFKELFMCFLLLPASLAVNSTLNADILSNALFFFLFMLFFRFREKITAISTTELFLFSFILLITTLNKICYFPILFLLVLVPTAQFGSAKRKASIIGVNLILNLAVAVFWSSFIHDLIYPEKGNIYLTTYTNLRPGFYVNPDLQIQVILQKPFFFLQNLLFAAFNTIYNACGSWVGKFGWDSGIPNGLQGIFIGSLILFALVQNYTFKIWERLGLIGIALSMATLFILSQHLHWDNVGDFIEDGYMGKYYVAIFPLYFWSISGLFNAFFNQNPRFKSFLNRLMVFMFIIIFIDFWILILQRFYI
jgi:uncharacterized membrane protein